MTRFILGIIVLVGGVWLVWGRRRPDPNKRAQAAAAASGLREGVLSRQMLSGLSPSEPGSIRGVVMDWNLGSGLATLVAIDDGTVSLYLNPGGGIIGAGSHAKVATAARAFRAEALRVQSTFHGSASFPPPEAKAVVFYVLTDSATLSSGSVPASEVQNPEHPLAALGAAAQALLAEVRTADSRSA